jgi:hypothetical protein
VVPNLPPSAEPDSKPQPTRKASANGTFAGLPRRVRQANLAPQLRDQPAPLPAPTPEPATERSPDEARALFSAFQQGARRGREDSEDFAHQTTVEKGET